MNENTNSRESGGGSVPSPDSSQNPLFGEELPDLPEPGEIHDFGELDLPATPFVPANTPPASQPTDPEPAEKPEGASTTKSRKTIGIVVACSGLAIILFGCAAFFLSGYLHRSRVRQAAEKQDWAIVLRLEPENTEALNQMAVRYMGSNVDKSFEYLEQASALGDSSELHLTTFVDAYCKRIESDLSKEMPDEDWNSKLDDLQKAESFGVRTKGLDSAKSKLARTAVSKFAMMVRNTSRSVGGGVIRTTKRTTEEIGSAVQWFSEFQRSSNFDDELGKDWYAQTTDFASRLNALLESPESKSAEECRAIYHGADAATGEEISTMMRGFKNAENLGQYIAQRLINVAVLFCEKGDVDTAIHAFNLAADAANRETLGPGSLGIIDDDVVNTMFDGLSPAFVDRFSEDVGRSRNIYQRLKDLDLPRARENVAKLVDNLENASEIHNLYEELQLSKSPPDQLQVKRVLRLYDRNHESDSLVEDVSNISTSMRWFGLHGSQVFLAWEPTSNKTQANGIAPSFPVGATEHRLVCRLPESMEKNVEHWLASLPERNGGTADPAAGQDAADSKLRYDRCAKLYFGGEIGENSFSQDNRSILFVQRLIAVVPPTQVPSRESGPIAYEGRIFTVDREEPIQIHDVELGKSLTESGHPAEKILSQETSSVSKESDDWRRRYLHQLATADIDALIRESNEAAQVTAKALSSGPLNRTNDEAKLSDAQKQNIQLGKEFLAAVQSLCSGTESWTGKVNDYREAHARLIERFKSLTPLLEGPFQQQLLSLQTPSKIAIVSLADVVPQANRVVDPTDAQLTSSVGNRQYWSPGVLDRMIVAKKSTEPLAQLAQKRVAELRAEEEKRWAEVKARNARRRSEIASSGSGRGNYPKIDPNKPFIYAVIVPGGFRTRDFNQVKVTVFNGTGGEISVATKVNCNLYGDLFVDALTNLIPPGTQKTDSAHYSTRSTGGLMHKDAWEKRDYRVSCKVTGLGNKNVQFFYVVPDDVLDRFSTARGSSHLIPLSELDRQSRNLMK